MYLKAVSFARSISVSHRFLTCTTKYSPCFISSNYQVIPNKETAEICNSPRVRAILSPVLFSGPSLFLGVSLFRYKVIPLRVVIGNAASRRESSSIIVVGFATTTSVFHGPPLLLLAQRRCFSNCYSSKCNNKILSLACIS